MKNMMDVVFQYLEKNKDGVQFQTIWAHVQTEMKATWKELFPTRLLKEIEEDKIGELYTLMSIDGRFIRDFESNWYLLEKLSFEQAKQMRINIGENTEVDTDVE